MGEQVSHIGLNKNAYIFVRKTLEVLSVDVRVILKGVRLWNGLFWLICDTLLLLL